MQKNLKKVLSLLLTLVMVMGMVAQTVPAFAAEAVSTSDLPTVMEGLSIAYPYNTETVQLTGTPADHFDALTFESARGEVESAQMILSPKFEITAFELKMNGLQNENGNIIPGWAFDVFIQHYVSVSGSGNNDNWSDTYNMYNPTTGKKGNDGIFPDALIPQDAAIEAGENKIAAGKNGGIWVNLNVQNAAPGNYTGFATLTVNGADIQIPVSVHIYDVTLPEEVHTKSSVGIWWDMVQFGEDTKMTRELGDTYFDYLVSKRIMPLDAWNITRWDDAFAEYAINYLAVSPEISAYSIHQDKGTLNVDNLRTTLTYMIQENIKQIEAGNNIDLFKKAYLYILDEPRTDAEYAQVNAITKQLDDLKAELAPMLANYPALLESFMGLKQLVTAPNPLDKTYADKGTFFNSFIDDDYGNTPLTGDSYIYAPQYQWLNTADQRSLYAAEEELWWYGCCHPVAPFPTYHINNPLVSARVESWMRYAYGIDGFVYSSVNLWGNYNTNGSETTLDHFDYWNSYVNNGTPGDQILVLPGSDYGVFGPIGTIRIENIREGNEDYEYLWMLQNVFGVSDISTYTANLYSGTIPSEDASIHYNNRKALLVKLEELNIAANGETVVAPGNEGFNRGEAFEIGVSANIPVNATEEIVGLSFDYKVTEGTDFGIALMDDWTKYYGYYNFGVNGAVSEYAGVTTQKLDDGYIRVTFDMAALTAINADSSTGENPTSALDFLYMSSSRVNASGYIDNIQILDDIPEVEVPTEPPVTYRGEEIVAGESKSIMFAEPNAYDVITFDMIVPAAGGENEIGFCLYQDGSNYLGYFYLEKTGLENSYAGVSAEQLDDGYWRVTLDVDQITDSARVHGTPEIFDRIYIRNHTTGGYIDNVQCIVEKPEAPQEVFEGGSFTADVGLTFGLDNKQPITTMSFDYQITSGTSFTIAFMPGDWTNYYGNFTLTANGASYDGFQVQPLGNGYMRAFVDFAKVTQVSGTPTSTVIDTVYLRGQNCSADGTITNIRINSSAEMPVPGTYFPADTNSNFYFDEGNYATVSFEYKLISGEQIAVCVGDANLSKYYGYYEFNVSGATSEHDGVATEVLENGYIRVTLTLDELARTNGRGNRDNVPETVSRLYIRGSYSDAAGFLGNITYTLSCSHNYQSVVTAPTFTANGYTTYTCSVCGESYTDNETAAYTASVKEWNIALGDEISATFYLDVDARIENPSAKIAVGSHVTDAELVKQENGTYAVTVKVAAAQMTENISVQAVSGDTVSEAMTYTIRQYAEKILTGEYDARTQNLVKAMLNYGAMAQIYFDYNADVLANQDYVNAETIEIPAVDTSNMVSGSVDGIRFYGASLVFESKVAVRFYFVVDGDINSYTFSTGTPVAKNGMYYIEVDGINPQNYATDIALTVNDALTVTYSPLTYIFRKAGADNALANLVKAMYAYHLAAVEFLSEPEQPKLEFEGGAFGAGTGLTMDLDNDQAVTRLTFDYKIDSGDYFNIAWMSDWSNWFGYFEFNAAGAAGNYAGVTTRALGDGTIRVYIDFAKVTEFHNAPSNVLKILYIRGNSTTANGAISNICINEAAEYAPHGELLTAKVGKNFVLDNSDNLKTLSFEYKIVDGTQFGLALMPDWSNYFGYFDFDANGATGTYTGVVTEVLEDGYMRVTFDMASLDIMSKTPSTAITMMYFRPDYCDADVYIDNIWYEAAEPEVIEPRGKAFSESTNSYFYTECADNLSLFSFEYKITNDGVMDVYIGNDNGRYGNYYFGANGTVTSVSDTTAKSYSGVITEALEDGYIRVTLVMDDLDLVNSGTPGFVVDYIRIRSTSTAAGYVDAVQCTAAQTDVVRGEAFNAASSLRVHFDAGVYSTVSFDYKFTSEDGVMQFALLDSAGSLYYGRFKVNATGEEGNYNGVDVKALSDGYHRVTVTISEVTDSNGTPADIKTLYIRGSGTTASGYVDLDVSNFT